MTRTALFSEHEKHNAKIIDFHGWEMPIHFPTGIVAEHHAVRNSVGMFDVSHMGQILVKGKVPVEKLKELYTNDIDGADLNQAVYTHILDENAHIIDDTIVSKLGEDEYLAVPNASTIPIIFSWMKKHIGEGVVNLSDEFACLAVQGPKAREVVSSVFGSEVNEIKRFYTAMYDASKVDSPKEIENGDICVDANILLSRTGYTGEGGFEIIVHNELAPAIWRKIMAAGSDFGIKPIGLGARDTLRLEMGYLLSGTDFDGNQTTLETNCSWVIKWDHDFIGKGPLLEQKNAKTHDRMIGILLDGKLSARSGSIVRSPEEIVGSVTSGNFSPTLGRAIALARVKREFAKSDIEIELEFRGRKLQGVTTKVPFVKK